MYTTYTEYTEKTTGEEKKNAGYRELWNSAKSSFVYIKMMTSGKNRRF